VAVLAVGLAEKADAAQPRAHLRVGPSDGFASHGEARLILAPVEMSLYVSIVVPRSLTA